MEQEAQAFYPSGEVVLPGDHVTLRTWVRLFRRLPARVVYVPGISRRRPQMEHGGLTWVGIRFVDDGTIVGWIVDPVTRRLKSGVRFIGRGKDQRIPDDVELEPEAG